MGRWAWKGDTAALEEFMRYLKQFLAPHLLKRLQLLQFEFEPYAEGDDHSALLMAATMTITAVKLDNGTRCGHWAEIIARMVPHGDIRAVRMLFVALQQPHPGVRQVAAKALNRLPWWKLQCTCIAVQDLSKAMVHKRSSVRITALRMLTSVMSSRHAASCSPALCEAPVSILGRDMAVFNAALNLCLRDESSLKVRHAALDTLTCWQRFVSHSEKINETMIPQLSKPLNNSNTSRQREYTDPCPANVGPNL